MFKYNFHDTYIDIVYRRAGFCPLRANRKINFGTLHTCNPELTMLIAQSIGLFVTIFETYLCKFSNIKLSLDVYSL